jgi:hypothetical protein
LSVWCVAPLLARCGKVADARRRLLLGPKPEAVVVGNRTISPLDADTITVCRNVAVVDGFMLELRAGGLAGGEAHLSRLERRGVSGELLAECRLQLALACGRAEEAAAILDRLCEPPAYLPMLASYGAAIALATNDTREFSNWRNPPRPGEKSPEQGRPYNRQPREVGRRREGGGWVRTSDEAE